MKTYNIGPIILTTADNFVPPLLKGRNEWITALRSGKYKQGHKYLHYDDTYCCLGVKRELEGCVWTPTKDDPNIKSDNGITGLYNGTSDLNNLGDLPFECYVDKMAGITLAVLNDHGLTFEQIAQIIEICWAENPS